MKLENKLNKNNFLDDLKRFLMVSFSAGIIYGCGPDDQNPNDYNWGNSNQTTQRAHICLQFACRPTYPENPTQGKIFDVKVYDSQTGRQELSQNTDAMGKFNSPLPLDLSKNYNLEIFELGESACLKELGISHSQNPSYFTNDRNECSASEFSYFADHNIVMGDCDHLEGSNPGC